MPTILIVDDNINLIALMGKMLTAVADISFATNGQAALRQMRACPPDLVLLDEDMPGMSGGQVCEAMSQDPDLAAIPVIFVTGHTDSDSEVRALIAGAVDFIAKPVHEAVLLARVRTHLRLKSLSDELRRSAALDGLTQLSNRGAFDSRLLLEWSRAGRLGTPLSVILLDVDHFKQFNDRYGHPAGDRCLQAVAGAVQAQARRSTDVAGRVGGEEFALLLPDTPVEGAQEAAERLRADIAALQIAHGASPTSPCVTVSIGIASCVAGPQSGLLRPADLIEIADQALYKAKSLGRNRVCRAATRLPSGVASVTLNRSLLAIEQV